MKQNNQKKGWIAALSMVLVLTLTLLPKPLAVRADVPYGVASWDAVQSIENAVDYRNYYVRETNTMKTCPTASAYYAYNGEVLGADYQWRTPSEAELSAYWNGISQDPQATDNGAVLPFTFAGDTANGWLWHYMKKDVCVVNAGTVLRGDHGYYWDGARTDQGVHFYIDGRKADGSWETVYKESGEETGAFSFALSSILSNNYVYYQVTSWNISDSVSTVDRLLVPEENWNTFTEMLSIKGLDANGTVTPGPEGTMYRLYNPNNGEHFYTANAAEATNLVHVGWSYEYFAWTAPAVSGTPVYRLYNSSVGYHHYTVSAIERDHLISIGWVDEGIGWYSDDANTTPLYRLYNPNATGAYEAGGHHYTTNAFERDSLVAAGWIDEGIGWYGL